jgi:hypothetical protein
MRHSDGGSTRPRSSPCRKLLTGLVDGFVPHFAPSFVASSFAGSGDGVHPVRPYYQLILNLDVATALPVMRQRGMLERGLALATEPYWFAELNNSA